MQDIWPKFVECIQGMSFGVKYYRYDNATSKGVPFDTNNRQVVLSDNPLTRMLQEGKPLRPHTRDAFGRCGLRNRDTIGQGKGQFANDSSC